MANMKEKIIPLPKEQWKGTVIPMRYTTEEYYDVKMEKVEEGYEIAIHRSRFDTPVSHYPEEYDFPDKLYADHWEKAFAWGIVEEQDNGQELIACIETCPEEWSNRLIVTELWVHEKIRRQGAAHALMEVAKEQAVLEHRRAIILETQSCNVGAITFYQKEGFEPIGLDTCCYSNRDLARKEVRINMGYFPRRPQKVSEEEIRIRKEEPCDYHKTEQMTLLAFWNKYRQGCDEHLLVHKLRESDTYVPELSRVAAAGDEIAGCIYYSRAWLERAETADAVQAYGNDPHGLERKEILVFGPLCVAPAWQGCGVGGLLLKETLALAKKAGYEGVVIFGEPEYYPRHGFQTCDHFGVTTAEGKNFDAFMGLELVEGGLSAFGGRLVLPHVFADLTQEENEAFTREFETPLKQKFPGQWD